jgi:predicted transcriptional regulator
MQAHDRIQAVFQAQSQIAVRGKSPVSQYYIARFEQGQQTTQQRAFMRGQL